MLLSKAQVHRFWRDWEKACRAQGWTKAKGWTTAQREAQRKLVLGKCGFTSLTLVDGRGGFDKVLALLGALANNLAGALELDHPEIGESRRSHFGLREVAQCLAHYGVEAESYLQQIINDKFNHGRGGALTQRTIDELSDLPSTRMVRGELIEGPSELQQLRMTAWARLQEFRKDAGHSLHEMKTGAGVPCDCAACARARREMMAAGKAMPHASPIAEKNPF